MSYRYAAIRRLLRDGYPYKILGNDGLEAVLVEQQRLVDHDYCAVYRYPGGDCCHGIEEIKRCFVTLQELPDGFAWWKIVCMNDDGKTIVYRTLSDDAAPETDADSIGAKEKELRERPRLHVMASFRERDTIYRNL